MPPSGVRQADANRVVPWTSGRPVVRRRCAAPARSCREWHGQQQRPAPADRTPPACKRSCLDHVRSGDGHASSPGDALGDLGDDAGDLCAGEGLQRRPQRRQHVPPGRRREQRADLLVEPGGADHGSAAQVSAPPRASGSPSPGSRRAALARSPRSTRRPGGSRPRPPPRRAAAGCPRRASPRRVDVSLLASKRDVAARQGDVEALTRGPVDPVLRASAVEDAHLVATRATPGQPAARASRFPRTMTTLMSPPA